MTKLFAGQGYGRVCEGILCKEHIFRFDIHVDHSLPMEVGQSLSHILCYHLTPAARGGVSMDLAS